MNVWVVSFGKESLKNEISFSLSMDVNRFKIYRINFRKVSWYFNIIKMTQTFVEKHCRKMIGRIQNVQANMARYLVILVAGG